MQSRQQIVTWFALAALCVATVFGAPDTVSKVGVTKVIVTIPVRGVPSSLHVKTIPELLSRVGDLSADEKKRILDGVESGFVTAVRLESDSGGQSSWLELSAMGSTLSRGDSSFKMEAPKLEVITNPGTPNKSPETTHGQ